MLVFKYGYTLSKRTYVTGSKCNKIISLSGHWKEESIINFLKKKKKTGRFRCVHHTANLSKYGLDRDDKVFYVEI